MSELDIFEAGSSQLLQSQPDDPPSPMSTGIDIEGIQTGDSDLALHDRILATISTATTLLLRSNSIEENLNEFLAALGKVLGIPYCFLFSINLETQSYFKYTFPGQQPFHDNLDISTFLEPHLGRITQAVDGFFLEPSPVDGLSTPHLAASIAVLPAKKTDPAREYLGLIDTQNNRSWTPLLRDALRVSAGLVGALLERHLFEEKYRENELRNRVIIEMLPDLVIRIDTSGKILDYTARKDHPLFINREYITGKMLSEIWPAHIVRKIIYGRKKRRALTQHILEEFNLPFSDKVYESRLDPIGSQEALIVIRDVTEQAELKQMKSDFINQASHELRTPVTSAILMSELIQEGGQAKEIEEYWQILNSELNRQKILIDRLLIAGRLESGMMHLELLPTDLKAVLLESISAVKPIARKKNISIVLSHAEVIPPILGDKSGLQQVFINLINNAVKFSPENSTVKVNVSTAEKFIEVAVSDQGMGIPANQTSHLFERFFRARDVTIAEIPGSGVGLYIVKSILEGIGGSIKLTSSSSAGTTFTATLRSAK